MSKKIISYVLTLAMIFSVFCNPALGYATTEAETSDAADAAAVMAENDASAVTNTTATNDVTSNVIDTNTDTDENEKTEAVEPEIGKVTGLKATALSHKAIKLTWTAVADAAEYQIYRYSKTEDEYVHLKTVKTNYAEISSLTKSTEYSYKVRACVAVDDMEYTGEFSDEVSCKTSPYLAKVSKAKGKVLSCSSVKISWKKVSGAKGYQIYRYNKTKKKYVHCKTTSKLYLNSTGLKADTSYKYKVRAYTKQDGKTYYGSFSDVVKCKTEKTDQQKVVALAKSKVGNQYRWGASGPKKFDCSGFVYWVYKNADVSLKKKIARNNSSGMYSSLKKYMVGSSIKSLSKAKPGDILFFKYGSRICHVGIYYKDGKMIHAANAKKDVCIEKVSRYNKAGYKVVGIARVLK